MRFSAAAAADRLLPERFSLRLRPLAERVDALLTASNPQAGAQRSSLAAFSVRVVSAAIALVSQIILARWMGGFEYGIYVLVWITAIIIGNLSCLGFHTTIIRYVPEYIERNLFDEIRGILWTGRIFGILASTVVALVGALGVYLLRDRMESYYVVPFYLGLIAVPMIALGDMLDGTARSRSWVLTALTPTYIARPLLSLLIMVAAVLIGFAPTAVTALMAAILATYVTTLSQLAVVRGSLARIIPAGARSLRLREWFVVSMPIFLVEGFFFLLINVDVLMVGRFMDPDHVAVYFATTKILAMAHFVYFAVKAGVAQRYSQLLHGGDQVRFARFVQDSVKWTFWPTLTIGLVLLALGEPLLSLFGTAFTEGYPLLFVLIIGVIARASVGPTESLLNMSGNQNICAALYAVALCINVALNILLIPRFGLIGAATATAVAMAFEASSLSLTVYRRLGIPMFIFAPAAKISQPEEQS
ncbi:multi antimicrobial extrusion protein MatE [Paramesorhizobium deserti]|uniref:Multi antimicrobial extrusion protein MatE n=1 Tax=Paramesorhizobium deserti TaxID=1494590 RepID=A0A135I1R7_9HYPH|nr:lipopolysaccharide biosynthesis protein [Paramesorhizobium deserti]KXF79381.1 multi antimicrobial extrusion protein MatE [Paramesorhizobium deserti]